MDNSYAAVIISLIALLISFVSLWVNSLSPFKLKVLHDAPTFALYKITPDISGDEKGEVWWIPSIDLGISFYNLGKISGQISDLRILAEICGEKYIFHPKWIVNFSVFQKYRTEKMKWLKEAVIREWYPMLIRGQSDLHLHIILEPLRWDKKIYGVMHCCLEIYSSQKAKWVEIERSEFHISDDLYEDKCSMTCHNTIIKKIREKDY